MLEILFLVIPILFVNYCIGRRIKYRQKLSDTAEIVASFIEDKTNPLDSCNSIYRAYQLSRFWVSMPIFTVIFPFIFTFKIIQLKAKTTKAVEAQKPSGYSHAFNSILDSYKIKNPITTMICILITSLFVGIGAIFLKVFNIKLPKDFGGNPFHLISK
ncbi:hypothetical protein [Rosenbergiella metrosideri]|uniref:hypothetical protein n=1 Tax=Rosenbergiella metrosideri TaxID=2921185 RepID=UPI001F4FC47B|nr:hypothetical protein [Rosenbergiella metrosideri]